MDPKKEIMELVDAKTKLFTDGNDKVWEFAETRFATEKSANVWCELLENEGFKITRGLANMEHAFVGEYGSGKPVIGILAEYDALGNMSQVADCPVEKQLVKGGNGHGCQHHLLGTGAIAGAVGIKDYMEKHNIPGTIKMFGCPAEESGYGKAFMARDGVFDGLDCALTWHPMSSTGIMDTSCLAVFQAYFHFKGISSHAANAPEHGRSALDAAELMNIGVNFLREHIIDEGRIHYAFMDAGGLSANVVQPTATLYYFVRAPKTWQVQEIYDRVVRIAKGAAMMTDTELTIEFDSAASDVLINKELSLAVYDNLKLIAPLEYTKEEYEYMQQFYDQLSEATKRRIFQNLKNSNPDKSDEEILEMSKSSINTFLQPPLFPNKPLMGSNDVGDVSWVTPTCQFSIASTANGTPPHSWQWVAVGKSSVAHKAAIAAGKTIAMTALDLINTPELLEKIQAEHLANLNGYVYKSAIPPEVMPR